MAVAGENHSSGNSLSSFFTSRTPILGLQLYIVIAATVIIMVVVLFLIFLLLRLNQSSKRRRSGGKKSVGLLPLVADVIRDSRTTDLNEIGKVNHLLKKENETIAILRKEDQEVIEIESDGIKGSSGSNESSTSRSDTSSAISGSTESTNIGWGRWYSLKELEMATKGFRAENVIGEGGYGVVFRGVLQDGSVVAVKKLLNNKGQAEKEFRVEVEAIGKVRHKNLAGLLGYCSEGVHRILVYEYIDNGNLEQWLHGDVGSVSPLTWEIRLRIAIGTARGLAYLHEGLEPKVVHRDVKSSNILLDRKWNPKVSDFGLAKLLGPEKSYVTTRVMGTFGYVSPDYASTGMLNEGPKFESFHSRPLLLISLLWTISFSTHDIGAISTKNFDFKEAPKFYNSPTCPSLHNSSTDTNITQICFQNAVNVAMTLDAAYLRGSMAAILSVLQHSSCPENVIFHFIASSSANIHYLNLKLATSFPYLHFTIYPFRDSHVAGLISTSIRAALDCPLNYARNYLADILPRCIQKVVYLDSDLVLVDDITKLAATPLGEEAVLAAPEYCNANFTTYFTPTFWSNPSLSLTFANRKPCYFNTGVMVIDLERWRDGDYTTKIVEWMELQKRMRIYELGSLPPFLLVFAGNIAPVDHKWNQHGLGGDNFRGLCRDLHPGPVSLLHWSGKGKPWVRLDASRPCPLDALWAPYDLLQTPYVLES